MKTNKTSNLIKHVWKVVLASVKSHSRQLTTALATLKLISWSTSPWKVLGVEAASDHYSSFCFNGFYLIDQLEKAWSIMHPSTLHEGKQSPGPGGEFMWVYFKNKLFLKSYFPSLCVVTEVAGDVEMAKSIKCSLYTHEKLISDKQNPHNSQAFW